MKPDEGNTILQQELGKPTKEQDTAAMFKAQRSTFKERRTYIENLQNSSVKDIISKYPILGKSMFVRFVLFYFEAFFHLK